MNKMFWDTKENFFWNHEITSNIKTCNQSRAVKTKECHRLHFFLTHSGTEPISTKRA